MNNTLEAKKEAWKGHTQTVTINGEKVEYSIIDLRNEADNHIHLNSDRKGVLIQPPSINSTAVLRDIIKLRGIAADTLFRWLIEAMQNISDKSSGYGESSWDEVKASCELEFYDELREIDELQKLFKDLFCGGIDEVEEEVPRFCPLCNGSLE